MEIGNFFRKNFDLFFPCITALCAKTTFICKLLMYSFIWTSQHSGKSHLKFSHPIHGFITIHWIRYITSQKELSHLDIRLTRGSMSYTRALSFWRHCLILSDSAGTFFVFHLAYCLPVNKKKYCSILSPTKVLVRWECVFIVFCLS